MNSGRHFSPPTPAFRPQDPFSNFSPRSAERVPSCDAVTPPPFRPRPVRMDPTDSRESGALVKEHGPRKFAEPQSLNTVVAKPLKKGFQRRGKRIIEAKIVLPPTPPPKTISLKAEPGFAKEKPARVKGGNKQVQVANPTKDEEVKKCEWVRCDKTFVAKVRGHAVTRRYCSATCRGRASEARTGKRTGDTDE